LKIVEIELGSADDEAPELGHAVYVELYSLALAVDAALELGLEVFPGQGGGDETAGLVYRHQHLLGQKVH
jgi:hypothetical protein